jgi:nitric oxide dioxygenase
LGQRHIGYGVKPEHYEIAGAALLATFREVLADKFDNETEAAWNAAYSMISSVMIYAANSNR